jgi:hypothetical protein
LKQIEIPKSVEILCSECFSGCKSFEMIKFKSPSTLTRIESKAFSSSGLKQIEIPKTVEILCSECFRDCQSFEMIKFESPSTLTRINSKAFAFSGLKQIEIPISVEFIAGSAFSNLSSISLQISPGSNHFRVEQSFVETIFGRELIRYFGNLRMIVIPKSIEILCCECFSGCKSFEMIRFESPSTLTRIESRAFSSSGLKQIEIPGMVGLCHLPPSNDIWDTPSNEQFISIPPSSVVLPTRCTLESLFTTFPPIPTLQIAKKTFASVPKILTQKSAVRSIARLEEAFVVGGNQFGRGNPDFSLGRGEC